MAALSRVTLASARLSCINVCLLPTMHVSRKYKVALRYIRERKIWEYTLAKFGATWGQGEPGPTSQ